MKYSGLLLIAGLIILIQGNKCYSQHTNFIDSLCYRKVILDDHNKIVPWYSPQDKAYDQFLRIRWDFIKTKVPDSPGPEPRSLYPQYYFYCSFNKKDGKLEPDSWMNDVGEKIPNWFESARLYYAYTGDESVMTIVKNMIDYAMEHGISPSDFAWPGFPYTTTNAGDTVFRGFSDHPGLVLHEIQVDHAGEMGLTWYRMYLYTGDAKYLDAAIRVADVLAGNARTGDAVNSVLPYRVVMETGKITSPYGANWTGCYMLFDNLIKAGEGNIQKYRIARDKIRDFLLEYPMKTGYWTDGHSDTDINSNTYRSNLSTSNMSLCMFDYPGLDPDRNVNIPRLIEWTEKYFVFRSAPGEPSTMWGANIVGEQDTFNHKMDYQTARYAAACARWYAISGDESYRERAYRSLNWVTYCNDPDGMAFESPVSRDIWSWWSDCYGECPRMFYHAFAGVPEWAPSRENHILYSEGILRNVLYEPDKVGYTATSAFGTEFLRLAFRPSGVELNGEQIPLVTDPSAEGYTLRDLGNGDYSVIINRKEAGEVVVKGYVLTAKSGMIIEIDGSNRFQKIHNIGVIANTASWSGDELKPEPHGWHAGDMHVHRNCGDDNIVPDDEILAMMEANDLSVISVLADMGNGEVKESTEDLPKVNGKDAPQSAPGRIMHWDAEWHWDATYSQFSNQALGGHIVLLGLKEAYQIWDESPYRILEWGKKQNAVSGFCHMQYLNDKIQNELDCCIPVDYPVEAALKTIDFLAEDVWQNDAAINAYYKLLNCGFRLGWAAGTDFPCTDVRSLGYMLTYVNLKDKQLTYQNWIEGLKNGRTVVSLSGHDEFIDLKVNGSLTPGDEIKPGKNETVAIEVKWTAVKELTGRIELVINGKVLASHQGTAKPGEPLVLTATQEFTKSGWICARRMNEKGHLLHTAPVYVTVKNKPVRASREDAQFFVGWIDNILANIQPGGIWNRYFTNDISTVLDRYIKARRIYLKIAKEAKS